MPDPYDDRVPLKKSRRSKTGSIFGLILAMLIASAVTVAAVRIYDRVVAGRAGQSEAVAIAMAERDLGATTVAGSPATRQPKNIILFIADGLGFAHLAAARTVLHGVDGPTQWDRFPVAGWQRAHPDSGLLTDSAAAATAMATGVPTGNGALGMDAAGRDHPTLFERANELGYRTGLVTDSYIWDATPAAFASHVPDRDQAESILRQMTHASLDVLFGELEDVGEGEVPEWQESVDILQTHFTVFGPVPPSFPLDADPTTPVAAIFEEDAVDDLEDEPNLPTLVREALRRLSSDERPFILMVESEEGDSASHRSDFPRLMRGMAAIEASLEVILDFAERNPDTLVVFTADHETGGLALVAEETNLNLKPIWSTSGHTGVAVPVLALGPNAERFGGIQANWQLGRRLIEQLRPTEDSVEGSADRVDETSDSGG